MAKSILIVDDEPAFLLSLQRLFGGCAVAADTAGSAAEATALLDRKRYDAAIVDIRLGGSLNVDGLEVLSFAKQVQPRIRTIVVTGCGSEELREEILRRGADAYFEKPVAGAVLCRTVEAFSSGDRERADGAAGSLRNEGRTMNTGQKRILVVDDSSTMRQLLRMILAKHLACEVTEAPDGLAALERLRAQPYDLVLTDINMPRLDGLGLVRSVREELKSGVPIVMVTTRGAEEDRDRGLALGADSYLTKPVDGGQVARVIGSLLA